MMKRNEILTVYDEISSLCDLKEYKEIIQKYKNKKKLNKEELTKLSWEDRSEGWVSCLQWARERFSKIKIEISEIEKALSDNLKMEDLANDRDTLITIANDEINKLKRIPLKWITLAIISEK